MRASIWVLPVLAAATTLAAPSYSRATGDTAILSEYFDLLASKVQVGVNQGAAPVCDLSKAQMPQISGMPQPTGLTLKHVAIGRGTQNYSCSPSNATAKPVSIGAVATLYNASCTAALYPDLLAIYPNVALQFNSTQAGQSVLNPLGLEISGHHFFLTTTTPFFNLDTSVMTLGESAFAKNATIPAPAGSPKGQGGQGDGSVAWLQLLAKTGATGGLAEAYRVNTAGGSPPATCADMPATFEVEYASEYWFWELP